MDELPDLRSDEDVDALMAKLRAKLGPQVTRASEYPSTSDPTGDPWSDFLAAQGEFTTTMLQAVRALTEAVDELQDVPPAPAATASASRRAGRATKSRTARKRQRRSRR